MDFYKNHATDLSKELEEIKLDLQGNLHPALHQQTEGEREENTDRL